MKWRHGYCEYSWSDLMGILNIYEVTSLVFWITKWRYGNIQKLTSWVFWNSYSKLHFFWIFKIPMIITSRIFKIPMSLWIFKISMSHIQNYTTSFEYSKYPWRHLMNIPNASWRNLMNIRNADAIWIFWKFMTVMDSLLNIHDLMGNLSIHEVRSTAI